MQIVPIPPKVLSCRALPFADSALMKAFGIDPDTFTSLGLMTCDQDDSLYVALDHATKFADVEVVFAQSFYAGSSHASGPLSGEILGILAAREPDSIQSALQYAIKALKEQVCFYEPSGGGPAFFPHVIAQTGRYLSSQAGIPVGASMAYLIAPPMESVIGMDAALKAGKVELIKYFQPPTETNFGGGYLKGELHDLEAAARAFTEAVLHVYQHPNDGFRKPGFERR